MAIRSRTYHTIPGAHVMWHFTLSGVRILGVTREGTWLQRDGLPGSQGNREFQYFASSIYVSANEPFNPGEKLWVLYET